jgi:SnoaL-like domain
MATTERAATSTLNGLSDLEHVALSRLVVETLWRIDHGHGSTVHELFTEDGEIRFHGELVCAGRAGIEAWGDQRMDPDTIRHTAVNLRFEADGPDAAKGSGVEVVYHAPERRFGPEATLPLMVGEWTMRCVRTEAGWRLRSIDFRRMFDRRSDPAELR